MTAARPTNHAATARRPAAFHRGDKVMHRRLIKTMLMLAGTLAPLAAIPAAPAQAQSITSPAGEIVLSIGRGELITVPGTMSDICVANDSIADVQVKSQRQLYVFGK